MTRAADFMHRHLRPAWVLVTLVPLALLLWMQYRWLHSLQAVSTIANRAALDNALQSIATDVQYFYSSQAERTLNVPSSTFIDGSLQDIAHTWSRRQVEGIRRLFVVDFTQSPYGEYWTYVPEKHALEPMVSDDEGIAIIVAVMPWQIVIRAGAPPRLGFDVNEHDTDHRQILNPVAAADGHVVGLAGAVLDDTYFRRTLLPRTIRRNLDKLLPNAGPDVAVSVHDHKGYIIAPPARAGGADVSRNLQFVFTDWTMRLHGATAAERWARASFVANLSLAVLLSAVLICGLAFALRAADRAMTLSQLKSDFVSNVSHELRTPLASIRVFAEFLRLGRVTTPEKVQDYGASIEAESRRLTRLIDNILDFARIESGRKSYRFTPTDLELVVETTLRTFEVRLHHEGFQVHRAVPPGLPVVDADPDAIGQALANLIDNALKYSGEAREIGVALAHEDGEVVVRVHDHGVGIPRTEHAKIFERFHRVGSGLVHDVKGSGLGLAIVRHIVEAHHGRVTLESEPDAGSTFAIHLPVAASNHDAQG